MSTPKEQGQNHVLQRKESGSNTVPAGSTYDDKKAAEVKGAANFTSNTAIQRKSIQDPEPIKDKRESSTNERSLVQLMKNAAPAPVNGNAVIQAKPVQMKKEDEQEEIVQAKANGQYSTGGDEGGGDDSNGGPSDENGGLPEKLKGGIESLSGFKMDDVKVHYNSPKPAKLQARAYAQGSDIHLGPGQESTLPHEAWHVVQQKQGRVQGNTQLKGNIPVNDDAGLEKEADIMGAKAATHGDGGKATKSKSLSGGPTQFNKHKATDTGKNAMNLSDEETFKILQQTIVNSKVSLDSMEEIAEGIAMLFPMKDPTATYKGKLAPGLNFELDGFEEVLGYLQDQINKKFSKSRLKKEYLLSMLTSENGSEIGEPSLTARAYLSMGLLSNLFVDSDLDYVMSMMESASPEVLKTLEKGGNVEYIINNLKVRESKLTIVVGKTKAKIDYLEQHIKNKIDQADVESGDKTVNQEMLDNKVEEAILLLKTFKNITRGSVVMEHNSIKRIIEWSKELSDRERSEILKPASKLQFAIARMSFINNNDKRFILDLFMNRSTEDKEEDTNQKVKTFRNFLLSKYRKKTSNADGELLVKLATEFSEAEKLKYLEAYADGDISSDPAIRQEAIEKFKVNISEKTDLKEVYLESLKRAFSIGSDAVMISEKGGLAKVIKLLTKGKPSGSKVIEILKDLTPAEKLYLKQNGSLNSKLKTEVKYRGHEWNTVKSLVNFTDNTNVETGSADEVLEQFTDGIELKPDYWATKISLSIADRSANSGMYIERNKNEVLSLVTQAIYAGQKLLKQGEINGVSEFTKRVYGNLSSVEQRKILYFKEAFSALNSGTHVSSVARLKTAELGSVFKTIRGYKIKPSAVLQAINDASGFQLLEQWSDFAQFRAKLRGMTDADKGPELLTYIPDLKPSIIEKLKGSLPVSEFHTVYRDMLMEMSVALKNDSIFITQIEKIGVENLSVRSEMLRSLGLLNREKVVDTGWQMRYFSAKAPMRKEAKRIVLHRLRKANKMALNRDAKLPDFESSLAEGNENMQERTEAFEVTKETAIQGIEFAVSIILGILTTVATMGLAAPLVAGGMAPIAASYLLAMSGTLIASSIKAGMSAVMKGAQNNTMDSVIRVVKDILMAATTVASGQIGGEVWDPLSKVLGMDSWTGEGSSAASRFGYSFFNKLLAVSWTEVACRNISDTIMTNLLAVEREDRNTFDVDAVGAYFRDFLIDAIQKTTHDFFTGDTLGMVGNEAETVTGVDDNGVAITADAPAPSIKKLSAVQIISIISSENFLTSQNYSVAEQDSVLQLGVDKFSDFISEKMKAKFNPDIEKRDDQEAEELSLADKIKKLPVIAVIDLFMTAQDYIELWKVSDKLKTYDISKVKAGKQKEIIQLIIEKGDYTMEHMEICFDSTILKQVVDSLAPESIGPNGETGREEIDGDVFYDAQDEVSQNGEVGEKESGAEQFDGDIYYDANDGTKGEDDGKKVKRRRRKKSRKQTEGSEGQVNEDEKPFQIDIKLREDLAKLNESASIEFKNVKKSNPRLYLMEDLSLKVSDSSSKGVFIGQFCAYLSIKWLLKDTPPNSFFFNDLAEIEKVEAVDTVKMWGGTYSPTSQANAAQIQSVLDVFNGEEIHGWDQIKTKLEENTSHKIWFGNNKHALAAILGSDGNYSIYDSNTGGVVKVDNKDTFIEKVKSYGTNVMVVS